MASVLDDDAWVCADCLMIIANGDASGMDDETEKRVLAGIAAIDGYLACNDDPETGEGTRDFSSNSCDVCGTHLAGSRHRMAILE